MARIDQYLNALLQCQGSDLHLPSGSPPLMRIHGVLYPVDHPPLTSKDVENLAFDILSVEDKERFPEVKNLDFAYEMQDTDGARHRFRGNTYIQKHGQNLVLRAIPNEVPTLESLGLPASLAQLTEFHQGIVLATGPSGCGKTSTLAALINIINEDKTHHIITIEDPIEYIFTNKRSLIHQRQVGLHVDSFQGALKDSLREDPDVIYVGELRDLETTQMAITAAETGHLVFTTLHTNSAIRTIDRIIDAFPHEQQSHIRTMLSESLKGVIAQMLVPRTDGQGRVAAVEVLMGTISVANMIRDGKTFQIGSIMQTGRAFGMRMMDDSLLDLVKAGLITRDEALKRAVNAQLFA
jgi:twitching motility protein PilT